MEPYRLSITEAKDLLELGEISAVELLQSVFNRIDEVEDKIGAYITQNRDQAMQQAHDADRAIKAGMGGPLSGIPLSIKDVACTQGLRTTCGSRMLESFVPPYDATVVKRLKDAGAVIVGKVSMDEFAMGSSNENCAYGVPGNPWNLDHVCGGSSGGSAASVAADMCLGSVGSDTGGSIRQPASFCGVVGMKPTYGRVSRYGLVAYASSLDQFGPVTKNVSDCALMLNVMCGYDEKDSTAVNREVPDYTQALTRGVQGMTVGIPKEYFIDGLHGDVDKSVRQGIQVLEEAGARLVEVSLPHMEYGVAAYYVIASAEASSNLARYDGVRYGYRDMQAESLLDMYEKTRASGFGEEVKRRIIIGTYALSSGYYDAYYKKASQVRTLIMEDYRKALEKCDVLISPVSPVPAWQLGEKLDDPLSMYLSDILTIPTNLAGLPGCSVPVGYSDLGMPIGLQIQAGHFAEETILTVAAAIEQNIGLDTRQPEI